MGQNLKTRQKRRRRKVYLKRRKSRIKAGATPKPVKAEKAAKKTVKKAAKKTAKKAAKKVAKKEARADEASPGEEEKKADGPDKSSGEEE